jgi:tRNA(Ile)-lysidine synthase
MVDRQIEPAILASLDRRLQRLTAAPIAVAFSGGGDSLMALKLTKAWADRHGRRVVALHVDHGLQAASAGWSEMAWRGAERLGVGFSRLAWGDPKPLTGMPVAARAARHRLLADAARTIGASVIVLGHTADDLIENGLMRAEGRRMGDPREWSPSPVWPEGRGLFLLRPLLGVRREAIRLALAAAGETWIDDPANNDPRSPRARVRPMAAQSEPSGPAVAGELLPRALAGSAIMGEDGAIVFDRRLLRGASPRAANRVIGAALTCAGGRTGPPRGRRLEALTDRLRSDEALVATLAGTKVIADVQVTIVRDAGEAKRGGLSPVSLAARETGVWDGRFEVTAGQTPLTARALAGRTKTMPDSMLSLLRGVDPARRPSLPLVEIDGLPPTCPILARTDGVWIKPLVRDRFLAACGMIVKEAKT